MSNIVQFPKEKKGSPPQSLDEVHDNLENIRHIHVDETVAIIAEVIFDHLSLSGFNFTPEDESYVKDVALAFEAITSMLYKYHSMDYPLQIVADELFTLRPDGTVIFSGVNENVDDETDDETTEEQV
jgi:hypothetical protein